jgi:hypothetical protein
MREPGVDSIQPVRIEHSIDEVWRGDQLEQYYNFLDYHFERDGAYCRARSYADDFRDVVLYGPFEEQGSIRKVNSPDFERDVLRYLERRFLKVSRR